MKLSSFINRVRRNIPNATVESVPDDVITGELNIGVNQCNLIAQVFKGYTEFPSVASQQIYSLNEVCPRYLGLTKNGVWWFESSGTSFYLFPKTLRWLDLFIRNWRDQSAGHPQWYWVEGNDLGFYPKPSTVNIVRVYHLLTCVPMDNLDRYPWLNLTTEVTALQCFDDAIIAYACWKLSSAVGKDNQADYFEKQFSKEILKACQQSKRRKDIVSDYDSFIKLDAQVS